MEKVNWYGLKRSIRGVTLRHNSWFRGTGNNNFVGGIEGDTGQVRPSHTKIVKIQQKLALKLLNYSEVAMNKANVNNHIPHLKEMLLFQDEKELIENTQGGFVQLKFIWN